MKVNILGSEWTIILTDNEKDSCFEELEIDGYTDFSAKFICIDTLSAKWITDKARALTLIAYHEIIHAFLYESGITNSRENTVIGHDELYIEWFAYQSSKIQPVFEEVKEYFDTIEFNYI